VPTVLTGSEVGLPERTAMRFLSRFFGLLILLGAIGSTAFLATWDIPPPTVAVKKTIDDDRFPR